MHKIIYTPHFKKTYQKLTKRNNRLKEITKIAIRKLADNPFSPSLKTHKTINPIFGRAWSSEVTRGIRIFWDFTDYWIILLAFGGYSRKYKVYK